MSFQAHLQSGRSVIAKTGVNAVEGLRRLPGGAPTVDVAPALWREWREDRVTGLAAEIAFFTVLSIFPALLAVAAALGSLEGIVGGDLARRSQDIILDGVSQVLGSGGAATTLAFRRLFEEQNAGVLTLGAAIAVVALSRGFAAVIRALDIAYDLDERRSWLNIRLTALILSIGSVLVAAVLLAVMVLGPLFGSGRELADAVGMGGPFVVLWSWLRLPLALSVVVAWSATVFHVAPNHKTPWRWDLPGAAVTSVVWVVVSLGFQIYLRFAAEGNAVFGVLGGALTLLFWLYLLAIGLLLGGEVNAVIAARHAVPQAARR